MIKSMKTDLVPVPLATVLVVDDAAQTRILVTSTLDRLGFPTLVAVDGESALHAIHDFHPDAIVTDIEMPRLNGLELIRAIRTSENGFVRELPVVVCSSHTDDETIEKLDQFAVEAVVPKPVDVSLLAETALRCFDTV